MKVFLLSEIRHNPDGVGIFRDSISQGSREARQPWAVCRNRFAVPVAKHLDLSRDTSELLR